MPMLPAAVPNAVATRAALSPASPGARTLTTSAAASRARKAFALTTMIRPTIVATPAARISHGLMMGSTTRGLWHREKGSLKAPAWAPA